MPAKSHRLSGLDGLRGVAALAVVCLHVWMYTDANHADHSLLLDAVVGEFRVAVGLFFVLSGFLLARPWIAAARGERPPPALGRFAGRRASRIVPAYWLAVGLSFLLLEGTGHGRAAEARQLPIFTAFLENMFAATRSKLDPPMWSLGIEVTFYAALPLIGWALVRSARRRSLAGPLAVCAALIAASTVWLYAGVRGDWPPTTMWTLPSYLPLFACGIAAALLAHGRVVGRAQSIALLLGGWALVLANGYWHEEGTGFVGHVVGDLPAAIGFGAVIVAVAARPPGLLSTPPLQALGTLSYGIYLWHMPTMFALQLRGALPHAAAPAFLRVIVPTIVLATASWFLVERPSLLLAERSLRRRPGAGARRAARSTPTASSASAAATSSPAQCGTPDPRRPITILAPEGA